MKAFGNFLILLKLVWFWKRLPRNKVPITSQSQLEKVIVQKSIMELWTVIFPIKWLSISFLICSSVMLNMTYTCMDSNPPSYYCKQLFFNQKHKVGWFLLIRFVDLLKVCSLHIISRNHSNMFLLINLEKIGCSKMK